jgi:hypothetical protein
VTVATAATTLDNPAGVAEWEGEHRVDDPGDQPGHHQGLDPDGQPHPMEIPGITNKISPATVASPTSTLTSSTDQIRWNPKR